MKRDWREVNRRYVREGYVLIGMDFLDTWDDELRRMNKNKRGRPYEYPESFIRFLGCIYAYFHIPYRQLEGFLRRLACYIPRLGTPSYTEIFRRIQGLDIDVVSDTAHGGGAVYVALDSTGIKVSNRGDWLERIWSGRVRRGYLKMHVLVDADRREILSLKVSRCNVSDSKMFVPLMEDVSRSRNIVRVYGDGAYSSREHYRYCGDHNIEPVLRLKRNVSIKNRGAGIWGRHVREFKRLGYEGWKEKYHYEKRLMVESVFSSFKRRFGEHVRARNEENMVRELELKACTLNMLWALAGA